MIIYFRIKIIFKYLFQEIPDIIDCTLPQAVEKINSEEREELKVSGKNQFSA